MQTDTNVLFAVSTRSIIARTSLDAPPAHGEQEHRPIASRRPAEEGVIFLGLLLRSRALEDFGSAERFVLGYRPPFMPRMRTLGQSQTVCLTNFDHVGLIFGVRP
jgi:hypothetical protein